MVFFYASIFGLAVLALIVLTALVDFVRHERALKRAMLAGTALVIITCSSCALKPPVQAPTPQVGASVCWQSQTRPSTGLAYPDRDACQGLAHVGIVNHKCGPFLTTHAEDDACVTFWSKTDGDWIIAPLSYRVSSTDGPYSVVDVS
jgi:hypothetical protein